MKYYRTILNVQAVGLDPDAEAFLTAAGITDATITNAINTLVLDLKDDGLWSKMTAVYPFVGGTSTTHKFNLKDPRDANDAYRLTFFGSPTQSVNGVSGNGSTQYFETYFNPFTDLSTTDLLYDVNYYSLSLSSTINRIPIGAITSPPNTGDAFLIARSDLSAYRMFSSAKIVNGVIVNKSFLVGREGNDIHQYINDTFVNTNIESPATPNNRSIFGLAGKDQNGNPQNLSVATLNWIAIGEGFNRTDIENLITIRNNLLTALGR